MLSSKKNQFKIFISNTMIKFVKKAFEFLQKIFITAIFGTIYEHYSYDL